MKGRWEKGAGRWMRREERPRDPAETSCPFVSPSDWVYEGKYGTNGARNVRGDGKARRNGRGERHGVQGHRIPSCPTPAAHASFHHPLWGSGFPCSLAPLFPCLGRSPATPLSTPLPFPAFFLSVSFLRTSAMTTVQQGNYPDLDVKQGRVGDRQEGRNGRTEVEGKRKSGGEG